VSVRGRFTFTRFSLNTGHTRSVTYTAAIDTQPLKPAVHVLVVDDDVKLASVIVRFLERVGYSCTTARSGDEALWAVNKATPDAIVMDVMIPHPSGIEVCRHMRAEGYPGPIVVISARSTPSDRAAAVRAGATDFLAKPFPLAELASSLAAVINRPD
jgi:DNA-binding response OmpR family regulator